MAKYKFIKYQNIYDPEVVLFALEKNEKTPDNNPMERIIDGARFIEATPDFQHVQWVRADSLKAIGHVTKEY